MSQLRRIKWGIEFRNENQKIFWNTIDKSDVTFCAGPAGCGKTYVAVYYALQKLAEKDNSIDGIIITKPLVEVGGEKLDTYLVMWMKKQHHLCKVSIIIWNRLLEREGWKSSVTLV